MKNQLIIFSKNRGLQLDGLLYSINLYSDHLFDKISVIYKADSDYIEGYNILKDDYEFVNFIEEKNFKKDLISNILDNYEFTTFGVDDCIFYEEIKETQNEILEKISSDVVCFSCRLGTNCVYSHPANLHFNIRNYVEKNGFLSWNWREQQSGDFNYPLGTDFHIFRTEFILNLIKNLSFFNPNTMESNMQNFLQVLKPKMVSFSHSKVVSIPINLVNDTHPNRNGLKYPVSIEELNKRFLNGEVIDIKSMDFSEIKGCHQELNFEFLKIE
jgi:hypothetical protein